MKWDLACFFQTTGSNSLEQEIESLIASINAIAIGNDPDQLFGNFFDLQQIDLRLREVDAFVCCLEAQDVHDPRAPQFSHSVAQLKADFERVLNAFDQGLVRLNEHDFKTFQRKAEAICPQFILSERRQIGAEKLPSDQESLISDLSVDGMHAWWNLYCALVGSLKFEDQGKVLSAGQAENLLSSQDRKTRQQAFHSWEAVWKEHEGLFSKVINHLAGFRLKVYAHRGWTSFLKEPLLQNRMSEKTLNAMWQAVVSKKRAFTRYFNEKAKVIGCEKLAWFDVESPFFQSSAQTISYADARALILEQFGEFSDHLKAFAERAFRDNWIEAEDRSGKRPGGFCIPFPKSRQSRIFMTYSGTPLNVATLAHELGHGYHNAMVEHLPSFAQHYRMNIAETASTFAELIVLDSLIAKSRSVLEKRGLLAAKIQRSVMFLMNIHARFLFEEAFYAKRQKVFLSAAELCSLMEQSQKEAYCDLLGELHPHFWAAKMHFYFTDLSFYNFPYTFGYLFSLGIYALAKKEGKSFADKYDALLRDSGIMTVEDLALKHLGIDLSQPAFWNQAVDLAIADVNDFFELEASSK
ncbi:MAG: M3 family oligoendopeptidase [Parachlamydiales bacterium]